MWRSLGSQSRRVRVVILARRHDSRRNGEWQQCISSHHCGQGRVLSIAAMSKLQRFGQPFPTTSQAFMLVSARNAIEQSCSQGLVNDSDDYRSHFATNYGIQHVNCAVTKLSAGKLSTTSPRCTLGKCSRSFQSSASVVSTTLDKLPFEHGACRAISKPVV